MGSRKRKYIGIIVIVSFTVILYMIELLTSKPIFDVASFSLNYVISLPFILLSVVINSGIAVIMNKPLFQKQNIFARIIISGILVVMVAGFLVVVGNLPFISDMGEYVQTVLFWKSVAAATLLNIFLLSAVEYIMQTIITRNLQKENVILQYKQLKSQINPHFLFNSLNVLIGMINKDQDIAVKYTKKRINVKT